jgi:spore coat protein CotH
MLKRITCLPLIVALLAVPRLAAQTADPADPFFDDSVLHEIRLTVNSKDWANLKEHFQDNTYYPADFRWRDQVVRNIGIRSRGTGSRRPNKPSLRVDFNRYADNQTFLGLKSVILRNNSQDASGLRERLSMLLFRRLGIPAEREAHTTLYVNNEFIGLFSIDESLDKDFLRKNLGENDGHLYEFAFDNTAALSGQQVFIFQDLGSNPAAYTPTPFKPETNETDPQGEVLARMVQAINDTSAAWRTNIAAFLDLTKFIRHLAIENFLAEEDGLTGDYGPNNFYFYRFQNTTKYQFLPWDKSNTFWDVNFSVFRNINDGPVEKRNRLAVRALQEADLLQLYKDTVNEAADSAASVAGALPTDPPFSQGWLLREITREYDQIHAAALQDTSLFTNAEFEQAITDLKTFAQNRTAIVKQQIGK